MAPSVAVEGPTSDNSAGDADSKAPLGIFLDVATPVGIFPAGAELTLGDAPVPADVEGQGPPVGALPDGEMGAPLPDPADVEAGGPLPEERRRRDLLAEAEGRAHKLTHLPKNPHCPTCTRAKMKDRLSKKDAFQRSLNSWGDIITCDHLYSGAPASRGLSGERDAFVVKDIGSGLIHAYPVPSQEAAYSISCMKHFCGRRKVNSVYSDNARELAHAARAVDAGHEMSTPGLPRTNSVIERTNQVVLAGATACLLEAGLPPCCWSFAAPWFA
jgi:hypothetical protein